MYLLAGCAFACCLLCYTVLSSVVFSVVGGFFLFSRIVWIALLISFL